MRRRRKSSLRALCFLCRPLLAQTSTTPHAGAHRHRVRRSCVWRLEKNRSHREPRSKGGSTLADLQQALEDYLPVLLGLLKDGSHLQYKVQFVWVNQEDDAEETGMSNDWYEVLSVLHLMAMLSLSHANLLFLPRTSADGYQPKVSKGLLALALTESKFQISEHWLI